MEQIREIGDKILRFQQTLGLPNPKYLKDGLDPSNAQQFAFLRGGADGSELYSLFTWRDGSVVDPSVPMGKLWIKPGYFLLSAAEALQERDYLNDRLGTWLGSWYPILSNGAADRLYIDTEAAQSGHFPVFYWFPESLPQQGQIYDNIEAMLKTILMCYELDIYFVGPAGIIDADFQREVEISRGFNPHSDYWRRSDLF